MELLLYLFATIVAVLLGLLIYYTSSSLIGEKSYDEHLAARRRQLAAESSAKLLKRKDKQKTESKPKKRAQTAAEEATEVALTSESVAEETELVTVAPVRVTSQGNSSKPKAEAGQKKADKAKSEKVKVEKVKVEKKDKAKPETLDHADKAEKVEAEKVEERAKVQAPSEVHPPEVKSQQEAPLEAEPVAEKAPVAKTEKHKSAKKKTVPEEIEVVQEEPKPATSKSKRKQLKNVTSEQPQESADVPVAVQLPVEPTVLEKSVPEPPVAPQDVDSLRRLREQQQQVDDLKKQLASACSDRDAARKEASRGDELKRGIEFMREEVAKVNKKFNDAIQQQDILQNEHQKKVVQCQSLEAQLRSLRTGLQQAETRQRNDLETEKRLKNSEKERERLDGQNRQLEKDIRDLKARQEDLTDSLESVLTRERALLDEKNSLAAQILEARQRNVVCEAQLRTALEDRDRELLQREDDKQRLLALESKFRATGEDNETVRRNLDSRNQEFARLTAERDALQAQLDSTMKQSAIVSASNADVARTSVTLACLLGPSVTLSQRDADMCLAINGREVEATRRLIHRLKEDIRTLRRVRSEQSSRIDDLTARYNEAKDNLAKVHNDSDARSTQFNDLHNAINTLQAEKATLTNETEQLCGTVDALKHDVEVARNETETLRLQLNEARQQAGDFESTRLQTELLQSELAQERAALGKLAEELRLTNDQLLLKTQTLESVNSQLAELQSLAKQHEEKLQSLSEQVSAKESEISRLNDVVHQSESEKTRVLQEVDSRIRETHQSVESERSRLQHEIASKEEAALKLQQELSQLREELDGERTKFHELECKNKELETRCSSEQANHEATKRRLQDLVNAAPKEVVNVEADSNGTKSNEEVNGTS